jgi:hypothetical protein
VNATVLIIIQALLQYGPAAAAAIQKILSNPAPTQADWDAVFAVAQTPYSVYVPVPVIPATAAVK